MKTSERKQSHPWKIQWKVLAEQIPDDTALIHVAFPRFLVTKAGGCFYVSERLLCLIFITFISKDPSTVPKQQTVVEVTTAVSSLNLHTKHTIFPGTPVLLQISTAAYYRGKEKA